MNFFVNGRPADSRAVYYGSIEGYHNALMKGKYPVCYLFLEIDPVLVDVNIHPAKREVRFRDEATVQNSVVEAVRRALKEFQDQPVIVSAGAPVPMKSTYEGGGEPVQEIFVREEVRPGAVLWPPREEKWGHGEARKAEENEKGVFAIHGIVGQLYILAENRHGLVIVDQHAAHERILYERLLRQVSSKSVPSQKLLMPRAVELSPTDFASLKEQIPLLERMGFGIAEFGKNSLMVDALPPYLPLGDLLSLFRSIADALEEAGSAVNRDRFREEVIAKTVCRAAVKANDPLKPGEAGGLLKDLMDCEQPYCCPHGRPTMIQITHEELEKKFGRRE
jgi:DNA mismatch repair protein MutL